KALVEYLYLDLKSCTRCIGTDAVLDEVMEMLTPVFKMAGYKVIYEKKEIETEEMANSYRFVSSPTIRVNGRDICHTVLENSCDCCSDISGSDVDCRVFEYEGEKFEVPPKEMLAEAVLAGVFSQTQSGCRSSEDASTDPEYELPENLKEFFKGKKSRSCCCSGGDCC
ncbi:MAG TPA: DUF2703 domain-containing protein, partial [Bacillota bacterium]|nr:DUF2703 domain-containing protein [Bacillota bacterium]